MARFLADGLGSAAGRGFPFGTLVINVSGAVILGLLTGLALGHDQALLAGTAAVGSYTTFSTWMFETDRLAEERQYGKAAANAIRQPHPRRRRRGAGRRSGRTYQRRQHQADHLLRRTPPGRRPVRRRCPPRPVREPRDRRSILLRGTEGFGSSITCAPTARSPFRHCRSPRSRDTRPRIEAVLGPTLELNPAAGRLGTGPPADRGRVRCGSRVRGRGRARHRPGGPARGEQARRLPRPPGTGLPGARLRGGL